MVSKKSAPPIIEYFVAKTRMASESLVIDFETWMCYNIMTYLKTSNGQIERQKLFYHYTWLFLKFSSVNLRVLKFII